MKRPIAMLLALLLTAILFAFVSCDNEPLGATQNTVTQIQIAESVVTAPLEPESRPQSLPGESSQLPTPSVAAVESEPQSSSEPPVQDSQTTDSTHDTVESADTKDVVHTHRSGEYGSDFTHHWLNCSDCGAEIENTRDEHDKTSDACVCAGAHDHIFTDDCDAICNVKNCFHTRIPTHVLSEATCFAPMTCSKCRITYGKALGHLWSKNRCSISDICTRCGTEGYVVHSYENGVCTRCSKPTSDIPRTLP